MKRLQFKKFLRNPKISWMDFNHRVLQEAANPEVPLIERLRFLGIYSNNLDEFYRVRIATLHRLIRLKEDEDIASDYADNPKKVLAKITQAALAQQEVFEKLYADILRELSRQKIRLINETEVNTEQAAFIYDFFRTRLVDSLNPIILSEKGPFPALADANIYLVVDLQNKEGKSKAVALVEVPSDNFSRFITCPPSGGNQCIILLEDVIRFCLPELFASLHYKNFAAYIIKITRDADLELEQDLSTNLLEKISRGLKNRQAGDAVRLVYDRDMPKRVLKFLAKRLNFDSHDTMAPGGRYHNFKDFMRFPDLGRSDLVNPPWPAATDPAIESAPNMLDLVKKRDLSLHYPYQKFSYFIRFLREAAIDPDVRAIKVTMYRLANDSRIVRALINAARNGKDVTAVVELFARFDESANIDWARSMQEAGIKVILGVEGLKIHCKLTHITRKGGNIACVSTGNFHEGNARVYTDFALMTADPRITREVNAVFDFIDHPYHAMRFNHLLVSPQHMRKRLVQLIRREIAFAEAGKPAYLLCKLNHLADPGLINRLFNAADAGVKIRMIVRGNCAMIPAGHANIEIVSIVDRNLEHSRIFIFGNGGEELYFLGSSDWMTRNFDGRIEAAVPVFDPAIQAELKTVIEYGFKDTVKARIVDGTGENKFKTAPPRARPFRSQEELYRYYLKKARRDGEAGK